MAVGNQEVGLEEREVEGNVADSVGTVDHGQDGVGGADAEELLVWHTDAGDGGDCVEDCESWSLPLCFRGRNGFLKGSDVRGVAQRISNHFDLPSHHLPGGLRDVSHGVTAGGVDGGEIQDFIFAVIIPDNISENGVYAGSGVGDEYAGVDRNIQQ